MKLNAYLQQQQKITDYIFSKALESPEIKITFSLIN